MSVPPFVLQIEINPIYRIPNISTDLKFSLDLTKLFAEILGQKGRLRATTSTARRMGLFNLHLQERK